MVKHCAEIVTPARTTLRNPTTSGSDAIAFIPKRRHVVEAQQDWWHRAAIRLDRAFSGDNSTQ